MSGSNLGGYAGSRKCSPKRSLMYRAEVIWDVKGSVCSVLKFALPPISPPLPSGVQYRAEGISWIKGSVCFVLKFALPPPLPSGMQISQQNMQSTFHTRIVQKSFSVIFPLPSPATPHGERNETLMHSRRRRCLYSTVSIYGGGEEI